MWETVIAAAVVFVALLGVCFGLYRSAAGKGGCTGCRTCDEPSCEAPDAQDNTPAHQRDT